MKRVTIAQLEQQIADMERQNRDNQYAHETIRAKLAIAEVQLALYKRHDVTTTLVIALEKTTEAVAHVISDLKRRS